MISRIQKQSPTLRPGRSRRGAALLVALALVLVLTMIVVGTQFLVVQQLKQSRSERNYERALQMAEAGANAYLNELANGYVNGTYTFMPPPNNVSNPTSPSPNWPVDLNTFRKLSAAGNASFPITHYPAGQTGQGFVVGHTIDPNNPNGIVVYSYGFCNGAVRMVEVSATSFSIFDWAAAYGIDPYSSSPGVGFKGSGPGLTSNGTPSGSDTGPAWNFGGSTNIVGASGAEGIIGSSNNATWYDGPIFLPAYGDTENPAASFNPTVLQSTPGVPTGHTGTGTLANPAIRRLPRTLNIPTADASANNWANAQFGANTSAGVNYFLNHNNNATGIRYLVQVTKKNAPHFGLIRELNDPAIPYNIVTSSNGVYTLDVGGSMTGQGPTNAGMTGNETAIGIRIYPGNYYITNFKQTQSDAVYVRSYADGEGPGKDINGNTLTIYKYDWSTTDPPNPNRDPNNNSLSTERNIRIWIGDDNKNQSSFSNNTTMENSTYASRFRIYTANRSGVSVSGTQTRKFQVNLLAYNSIAGTGSNAGQTVYYGSASLSSGTYLYGSLIAWKVNTVGGATIEKQAITEAGNTDRLTFLVNSWREIK